MIKMYKETGSCSTVVILNNLTLYYNQVIKLMAQRIMRERTVDTEEESTG